MELETSSAAVHALLLFPPYPNQSTHPYKIYFHCVNIWLFIKQYFCILVTSTQDEISSWIAKEAQINGEGNPPFYHPFLASQISNNFF